MSRFLPIISVIPALVASGLAHADETKREETVIVTVPGPDRIAGELIGNASSLDRETLTDRLSSTLGDTLDREPGVSTTFFGQGASRPVLRGLGAERVQVLTNGLGVIDASAASPDHQVAADGIDAERVEILRGPAALAYGGQAIGGVVNVLDGLIVETLPDAPVSGELFGAYNDVNEGHELAGRGQFVAGDFVLTVSASQRDFGDFDIPGFAESSALRALEEAEEEHEEDEHEEEGHEEEGEARNVLENSYLDTQTLAAGLSWVGDGAYLGISVRDTRSEYGLPGHAHEHGHEEEDHDEDEHEDEEGEELPFIDLEQTRIDLRAGVEFGDEGLTGMTGSLSMVDYTHTEFEAPGEAGTVFDSEGLEARLELDHALGDFEGAFGLQYLDKDLEAVGEEAFLSSTQTEALGLFLYEAREWDSGFGIEGGARVETVTLDNVDMGEVDFDLVSGAFGLHQHLGNGWFVGSQLAYTERAPNESELFAFGPHLATEQFEVGDAGLGKESGLNLEATARWSGERLGFGMNVFAADFSDFIYLEPGEAFVDGALVDEADELPVFLFVQDEARFYGGEIYGDLTLADGPLGAGWVFGASLEYVDGELDDGANVPLLPPLTLNADASAEWGIWEVGAAVSWAADQNDPGEGQLETEGYTVLDLRGEVDLSDFAFGGDGTKAFIEVRNASDEEVRYSTSVLKDVVPAPGRNVRLGVRAVF